MFEDKINQKKFLEKYNIPQSRFDNSMLTWGTLDAIVADYNCQKSMMEKEAQELVSELMKCSKVHAVNFRFKDDEHLAEKIIRKNSDCIENSKFINCDNYKDIITDLIGVRVLLLYKEDWEVLNDLILEKFSERLHEKPFAYIREGDDRTIYDGKIQIKSKPSYRSIHYVLDTEIGVCIEIQVRTLAEEAWGEIDHNLRYPYRIDNEMINHYMKIIGRLSGTIDEMSTFVCKYIRLFELSKEKNKDDYQCLFNDILEEIKKKGDTVLYSNVKQKIDDASQITKFTDFSEIIEEVLSDFGGKTGNE